MTDRIHIRTEGTLSQLRDMRERARDLRPVTRQWVAMMQRSTDHEFRTTTHFHSRGGVRPWKKWEPFGNVTPPKQTLNRSGKLRRAAAGHGPGAIQRYDRNTATVGISGRVVPQAAILRGGTGLEVDATTKRIKPKRRIRGWKRFAGQPQQWKMWWYLFFVKEVTLSAATMKRGLLFTPRPFMQAHPLLRHGWRQVLSLFIRIGKANAPSLREFTP